MKEAIGNTYLTALAVLFLSLIMALLIATLTYSKAYKAKNKIVSVIEKYNGFTEEAEAEVNLDLHTIGYRTNSDKKTCKDMGENSKVVHDADAGTYDYCVYEIDANRGKYYRVVTFMHFDVPVVGGALTFEVKGDSRTVYSDGRLVG